MEKWNKTVISALAKFHPWFLGGDGGGDGSGGGGGGGGGKPKEGGGGGKNPRNVCEGDNEERPYTKLNPAQFPMHFLQQ